MIKKKFRRGGGGEEANKTIQEIKKMAQRSVHWTVFRAVNRSTAEMPKDMENLENPQIQKTCKVSKYTQMFIVQPRWGKWMWFDWGLGALKTLIGLIIMGGRIWKTDDSVSTTREFSFLSHISLVALTIDYCTQQERNWEEVDKESTVYNISYILYNPSTIYRVIFLIKVLSTEKVI